MHAEYSVRTRLPYHTRAPTTTLYRINVPTWNPTRTLRFPCTDHIHKYRKLGSIARTLASLPGKQERNETRRGRNRSLRVTWTQQASSSQPCRDRVGISTSVLQAHAPPTSTFCCSGRDCFHSIRLGPSHENILVREMNLEPITHRWISHKRRKMSKGQGLGPTLSGRQTHGNTLWCRLPC